MREKDEVIFVGREDDQGTPAWACQAQAYCAGNVKGYQRKELVPSLRWYPLHRQGCLFSPLKFIAWMDALLCWLHNAPSDIQLGDGLDLHTLAYADDLWLTREALQAKLDKASAFLNYHGVHCNAAKSNYSTNETGFRPDSSEQPGLLLSNLRTGRRVPLTPVQVLSCVWLNRGNPRGEVPVWGGGMACRVRLSVRLSEANLYVFLLF